MARRLQQLRTPANRAGRWWLGAAEGAGVDRRVTNVFDDPRQQVVYELTSALIGPRVVPQGLYQRARELLGDKGIVDVTVLLGWFTGVSLPTLAAYDVPSHAAGLIP